MQNTSPRSRDEIVVSLIVVVVACRQPYNVLQLFVNLLQVAPNWDMLLVRLVTARSAALLAGGAAAALSQHRALPRLVHTESAPDVAARAGRTLHATRVCIAPYGVLGTRLTRDGSLVQVAPPPSGDTAFVECVNLRHATH